MWCVGCCPQHAHLHPVQKGVDDPHVHHVHEHLTARRHFILPHVQPTSTRAPPHVSTHARVLVLARERSSLHAFPWYQAQTRETRDERVERRETREERGERRDLLLVLDGLVVVRAALGEHVRCLAHFVEARQLLLVIAHLRD